MALSKILALLAIFAVAHCQDCVPSPSTFYWKTPCDNQKFTNQIIVTNIDAYQNGQPIDNAGGIDATVDIVANLTMTNNYNKEVTTPLVDLAFRQYTASIGGCKWSAVPLFGAGNNHDACALFSNCHLNNPDNPTTWTVTANIADIAGPFIGAIQPNVYYGISLTYKEGTTGQITCFYFQDKVIKV